MARVVLILVIGTILMFIVVLQTPPQFVRTALSSYVNFAESAAPADAEKEKEKEKKPAARQAASRKRAGTATIRRASNTTTTPEAPLTTLESRKSVPPAAAARDSRRVFSVANDGTALYSHNSPSGAIVKVLRKGTVVEPQLEINDAGQMWEFVNVIGEDASGFLRANSLERQSSRQSIQ